MFDYRKKGVLFENPHSFAHQFFMDGGQVEIFNYYENIYYPLHWDENYEPDKLLYQEELLELARSDIGYEGHRMETIKEFYNLSDYQIKKALKEQRLGAVKKYRRWYPYKRGVSKLKNDLLKKKHPERYF